MEGLQLKLFTCHIIRHLEERCRERRKELHIVLIDLGKAYNGATWRGDVVGFREETCA